MKILSDSKQVEYNGTIYTLSKLERHVLYCVDDQRSVSSKYTQQDVDQAVVALTLLDLITADPENDKEYMTETGAEVVNLLRESHD